MYTLQLSLFKPPPSTTTTTSSAFLNGGFSVISAPTKPSPSTTTPAAGFFPVRAMKVMQGRVVCATSDKTVAVEVTRMAPHPKYKRRIRKKKKYQAHDPDNLFKVGDLVQLEKCRPISKTKNFLAVAPTPRAKPANSVPDDLDLPLQSEQVEQSD